MAVKPITSIRRYVGLSTDVKPTAPIGSTFFEADTGFLTVLDGDGNWNNKKSIIGIDPAANAVQLSGSNVLQDENGNDVLRVTDKNTLTPLPSNYKKIVDKNKYEIWDYNSDGMLIKAIYKNIVVAVDPTTRQTLYISTTGFTGDYTTVELNSINFPNLYTNDKISNIYILPWTRNRTSRQTASDWRIVVVTDYCGVYHNFPSRAVDSDGTAEDGDFAKFDESVIWDLPEKKYPSTDPAASGTEMYFPCLPSFAYTYHPGINVDNGYGNGGFDKSKTVGGIVYPRFYIFHRAYYSIPLVPMNSYEPGDKITLIGTYNSNSSKGEGTRICVFATDDGGRQWYCKYEFADDGTYMNWGNAINTSSIVTDYAANSFQMIKKTLNYPSGATKEPETKFTLGTPVTITSITKDNAAVVTTVSAHNLSTGNIIAIQANGTPTPDPNWDWIRNDTISTTSGGNGLTFKVEVINSTSFKLYEEVHSAFNNIPCRHIHHINRIKDGYIIGTGETYPNGWIFYAQTKESDNFDLLLATDAIPFYRLNSSILSVQRTLGGLLLDDDANTLIFALDDATITRSELIMPSGRTDAITRSSTGIYTGKLSDIDDFTKFTPICETQQVAYYFGEKCGCWIFVGQRGEFAISFDNGVTWDKENLYKVARYFNGENGKYIVMDQFVIVLK